MPKENKVFEFGPFRLDLRERRLTRDGHSVPLRGRVFDTLLTLVSRHGCLVTKDELMAAVWPESVVEETNLNHNICVLRRALGEKATGQKYVETVPRQGYRFVADVRELKETDESSFPNSRGIFHGMSAAGGMIQDASALSPETDPHAVVPNGKQDVAPGIPSHWYQERTFGALVVIAMVLVAGYVGVQKLGHTGHSSASRVMLAVLPFENLTGDSAQKYVADGLSREIISELGRWNSVKLGVIAHTSSSAYQGRQKPISEIGRELRVDYIVEGSVRRNHTHFRITVMLIRVDDQAHLWAANYDHDAENVLALQVEVTQAIIREIGSRIAVEPGEGSLMAYPFRLENCRNGCPGVPVGDPPRPELINSSQPPRPS